jgi:hypothetical protein
MCSQYTTLSAHGTPQALQSPAWAYKVGLAVDRDDPSIPLEDAGSAPNQVIRGVEEWGTLDASDYPLDLETICAEPTLYELERASRRRLLDWRRIFSRGADLVEDLRRAIAGDFAPVFAIDVDPAFEDFNGQGEVGPMAGENRGGHMLYLVAYDTLANGQTIVTLANSWGRGWGASGYANCTEAFIARMSAVAIPGIRMAVYR